MQEAIGMLESQCVMAGSFGCVACRSSKLTPEVHGNGVTSFGRHTIRAVGWQWQLEFVEKHSCYLVAKCL